MNNALDNLLREPRIWRAGNNQTSQTGLPSGFAELDAVLPEGGWPTGALTEVLHGDPGIGELRLVMPALARLSRAGRWIALVAPPHIPYAPALAAQGVDLSRILLIHPRAGGDTLWALEQAMRSGSCAAVLAWPRQAEYQQLRRLQLAAEAGRCWGLLFRPERAVSERSPAALRLTMQGRGEDDTRVDLLKVRGAQPRSGLMLDLNNPRTRVLPMHPARPAAADTSVSGTSQRAPVFRHTPRPTQDRPQLDLPLGQPRPRRPQLVHP
ncbi:translesion DNA synthesis-associated protein ImuA [Aquisalimonas sp.]|uniref:translesion DNA synthesis-associated protein ImuA n=1 Tax=unclassified Aquisalimonas TaxID=2644645 RepID=UPI0025BAE626|nr:translesion DNA synthesis-associated protein ImuA [Aquisalimonas sp.]